MAWHRASIGKKTLMSLSGLLLLAFVIAHLLGNLLIYGGPDAINAYARKLRDLGPLLWVARGCLLAAAAVHVLTSIQLRLENRRARPQRYRVQRFGETTLAARTMMRSGLLVLAYLAYHLLHFTFRVTNPQISHATDALGRHDVYAMMVLSFQRWPISLAYVAGMAALCLHLEHGIGSTAQTLGLNNRLTVRLMPHVSRLLAVAIFLGYASIPLAVLSGVIPAPASLP
jgi:succinate dehydrogenase / fumarate reductase cytochrome b subunit